MATCCSKSDFLLFPTTPSLPSPNPFRRRHLRNPTFASLRSSNASPADGSHGGESHLHPPPPPSSPSSSSSDGDDGLQKKRISQQSSWEATDSEGKDYLYRLGQEADNMNIAVGARKGVIDDLFVGNFLGKDSDIVFEYRQKATRSFEYLQGDYYIAPAFMDKIGKLCNTVPGIG